MKQLKYLPIILLSGNVFANGHVPAPMSAAPAAPMEAPQAAYNVYAGFGGGLSFLGGNRDVRELTPNAVNRTTNRKLSSNSAKAELFAGAVWNVPNSKFGIGLEPHASYSNAKSVDFNNVVVGLIGNVPQNDGAVTTISSRYSLGLDFKPVFNINKSNQVYLLLGYSFTGFQVQFTDRLLNISKNKAFGSFDLGVGYEYRINESSVGIRFRHSFIGRKNVPFAAPASTFNAQVKPQISSVMLTYKYSFKG